MKKFIVSAALLLSMGFMTAKAESVIYIMDNYNHKQMDALMFNGDKIPLQPKVYLKDFMGLDVFKKGLTKCIVKNDGRIMIVRDATWAGKPYHDEMTLDLNDGETYYLELMSGPKSTLKLLNPKKGAKEVEKILKNNKDWTVFEDIVYEN